MTKIFDQCKKSRFYRLFLRPVETLGKIDGDGVSLDGAEALSLSPAVDCRIGSLEKLSPLIKGRLIVDCRVGSLETLENPVHIKGNVDCRIGSLENLSNIVFVISWVDCRIGSLEILDVIGRSDTVVDCRIGGRIGTPAGMQESKMKKAPLAGAFLMACFLLWCVPFGRGFMGGEVYRR